MINPAARVARVAGCVIIGDQTSDQCVLNNGDKAGGHVSVVRVGGDMCHLVPPGVMKL